MSNLPAEIPEESLEVLGGHSPGMLQARLQNMRQGLGLMQSFFKEVMVKGQDYGVIPGTKKPSLLKCGAEKLCELYDYAITVKHLDETTDRHSGFYRAKVTVALIQRRTGLVVAEGVGEANTMEGRYRWRWVYGSEVPAGIDKASLTTQERKGKNGKYVVYRVENDDPYTLWNTVLKMAKKRALVDAALSATRSSGIFTQDTEDLKGWIDAEFTVTEEGKGEADKPAEGTDAPAAPQGDAPDTEMKMPYGKHRGKPITDLDTDYLMWLHGSLTEDKMSGQYGEANRKLKAAVEAELDYREGRADLGTEDDDAPSQGLFPEQQR